MSCSARIRPFRPVNDIELSCERGDDHDDPGRHAAVLRDYAYPGSTTIVQWMGGDRRLFHGDWPGDCADGLPGCILPAGHPGGCSS